MSKHSIAISILVLAVTSAASSQTEAACKANDIICEHIAATREVLAGYQKAIQKQVKDTQKAYSKIAQAAEQGRRDEIEMALLSQQQQLSLRLADQMIEGKLPVYLWKESLLDYAALDLEMNREMLELERTDGARYLAGIKGLEAELGKAKTLDKILAALNAKQSPLEQVKDLATYGKQTNTEFGKLICAGLKSSLAQKRAALPGLTAAIQALKAQPESDARNKQIALKEAEKKAVDDSILAIEKERKSRECKD